MSKVSVEFEAAEALFVLAALDVQRDSAKAQEKSLAWRGLQNTPEYEIALATLLHGNRAYDAISVALYGKNVRFRGDFEDVPVATA